jgi:hypothetical protein
MKQKKVSYTAKKNMCECGKPARVKHYSRLICRGCFAKDKHNKYGLIGEIYDSKPPITERSFIIE